jgi:DNA-binding transcriptional LysR family regulator
MDNWDDYRYYLAVARSGAVSAAAKLLGVSHSTGFCRILVRLPY